MTKPLAQRSGFFLFGRYLWDAVFVMIIIGLIAVPDINKVLSVIFTFDHFYHLDSFVMAPGWASLNGLTLNVDAASQYSMVIPFIVARLADLIGGFSYTHVLVVLIAMVTVYFIAFYGVLRSWLGSTLWASFGILLALKLHLFHDGVSPIIWRYPSATAVRYWFDIIALYAVSRHCVTLERKYLWVTFLAAGIALVYMMDTGMYLWTALIAYTAVYLFVHRRKEALQQRPRDWRFVLGLGLLPFVVAACVLYTVEGTAIFTPEMWANTFDFAGFFLQGWGAMPMHEVLRQGHIAAFAIGFLIPSVYIWTLIYKGGQCLTGRAPWKEMFVVFLSVYGLCLYQYYVNRSALNSYYAVCVPFVAVVCYWLRSWTQAFPKALQTIVPLVAIACVTTLLTSERWFMLYPNVFNSGFGENCQRMSFFNREMDVQGDIKLIRGLTTDDERVCLISDLETRILIEARRKPFFYQFPLIESVPFHAPHFGRNYLYTEERLAKTLKQIDDQKPKFVFVERRFWQDKGSGSRPVSATLRRLVNHVLKNYDYQADGWYLSAFKRKSEENVRTLAQ